MPQRKILIVEDDRVVVGLVKASLKNDFVVRSVETIAACVELLQNETDFDLIFIDRMLPDGDGLNLCGQIRQMDSLSQVPVIFLSAKDSEADKVSGLFAGADDYMTKPFGPLELKARVMARLRVQSRKMSAGRLHLDVDGFRAFVLNGENKDELSLTPNEFKILLALMQSLGEVLSREVLLSRVWGESTFVNDRVVDSHISHIRKKLKESDLVLEALRGEGYRLSLAIKKPSRAS